MIDKHEIIIHRDVWRDHERIADNLERDMKISVDAEIEFIFDKASNLWHWIKKGDRSGGYTYFRDMLEDISSRYGEDYKE